MISKQPKYSPSGSPKMTPPQEINFLERVVSRMNASIYVLNLNPFRLEWINDSEHTFRSLGIDSSQIIEQGSEIAYQVLDSPDFRESVTEAVEFFYQNPNQRWYGVFRIRHANDQYRWIYATSVVFEKNDQGIPQKVVVTALDMTDHLNTNEALSGVLMESRQKRYKQIIDSLTSREIEIIRLLAKGLSTKEIADQLNRSFHTIETHRGNIKNKLGCKNVAEIATMGVRMGLVI